MPQEELISACMLCQNLDLSAFCCSAVRLWYKGLHGCCLVAKLSHAYNQSIVVALVTACLHMYQPSGMLWSSSGRHT